MGSIPFSFTKQNSDLIRGRCFVGAGNRNRTGTDFTPRDFKSLVSTYSTMPANICLFSLYRPRFKVQRRWRCEMALLGCPDIFLAGGAAASAVDPGHSLGLLHPPQAALPSLPLVSTYSTMPACGYHTISWPVRQVSKFQFV